jgi:hypothetical protein
MANGQTMHTLPGHPNLRRRGGHSWSLPAIDIDGKLSLL